MNPYHPYSVFPLGDRGLIIDFGNRIDEVINKKVLQLFYQLQRFAHPWVTDLVPAYGSLTVYYDVYAVYQKRGEDKTAFETMADVIEELINNEEQVLTEAGRLIEVPVCYAQTFASDIRFIAQQKKMGVEEVIQLHTSKTYRVYMIGFFARLRLYGAGR